MTALTEATVQLTVLLPALAALAGLLLRRRRALAGLTAVAAAALVVVLGILQFAETAGRSTVVPTIGPLPVGELQLPLTLLADRTSAVIAIVVAVVGLAVQVFSIWYLHQDPRYAVFAATVSLFLASMLLVVQSGDLVLTLVGWEVMGWCSYLLIGHTSARESARRAAYKAFLVTRFADIGFVLGLVILAVGAGSTELAAVEAHWTGGAGAATAQLATSSPALTAALVLLLVGIAGKSGLVPFHDWLPDAMEGPTPASALIHAATMVAAGTYVLARFASLFALDGPARILLGVLASITMVWAAALAFAQTDVKRLLAYSSIAHTGFILVGVVAINKDGLSGSLFYLLTYGFTTIASFAVVGLVRDSAGEATHLSQWRGLGRRSPLVAGVFAFLLFALAGIPLTSGFMAKFAVFKAAIEGGATVLVVVGVVASAVTAFFYVKVVLLMFFQEPALDGPTVAVPSLYTSVAIGLGLAVTVVLGVLPQPVLDLAGRAALFVR